MRRTGRDHLHRLSFAIAAFFLAYNGFRTVEAVLSKVAALAGLARSDERLFSADDQEKR